MMTTMEKKERERLIVAAKERVKEYPQYLGHFDGYILIRIKKDVRTKMGLAFRKGELAIAKPVGVEILGRRKGLDQWATAFSISNGVDTSISARAVDWMGNEPKFTVELH